MKTSKQKSRRLSRKNLLLGGAVALGSLILITQVAFDYMVMSGKYTHHDNTTIARLITQAAEDMNKPAVIEPVQKKVYMPEANLVLPFYPPKVTGVLYSYTPDWGPGEGEDWLSVTSRNASLMAASKLHAKSSAPSTQDTTSDLFTEVPVLQACARGIEILVTDGAAPRDSSQADSGQKRLADGRMAYFHENKACKYQPAGMLEYVKQVQSY